MTMDKKRIILPGRNYKNTDIFRTTMIFLVLFPPGFIYDLDLSIDNNRAKPQWSFGFTSAFGSAPNQCWHALLSGTLPLRTQDPRPYGRLPKSLPHVPELPNSCRQALLLLGSGFIRTPHWSVSRTHSTSLNMNFIKQLRFICLGLDITGRDLK